MSAGDRLRFDFPALMAAVESASPLDAVDVVAAELARSWRADLVTFLITDYGGDNLVRLSSVTASGPGQKGTDAGGESDVVPIHGTVQGQVLRTQQPLVVPDGGGAWVYAPVTSRGEAIGILQTRLPVVPTDQAVAGIASAAHMLAYVVVTNRRYTDLYEWGQRRVFFDLAAEMQRRLLPASFTCEAAQCTIAGWLEPARSAAGDTFDYILERDTVHISLTDAMGHSVPAALLATTAVAALRQARRRGVDLREQARYTNEALIEHTQPDQFVTGLLLRADLETGAARLINAGHPPPFLVRDGTVSVLHVEADPPFGMFAGTGYHVHEFDLRHGDRLLLITDGMIERNAADLDLSEELIATQRLHPREVVQHLIRQVAVHGPLLDDATVLCVDWHGHRATARNADAGADLARASAAL